MERQRAAGKTKTAPSISMRKFCEGHIIVLYSFNCINDKMFPAVFCHICFVLPNIITRYKAIVDIKKSL